MRSFVYFALITAMSEHIFLPFPVLHTPRLILRQPLISDAADLFRMRADPEVMRYIPRPLAKTQEEVEAWIGVMNAFVDSGEKINWAIEWGETGEAIGTVGFVNRKPEHSRAELGYSLTQAWHRKGIMREAVKAVLGFGFEQMGLHSVEAIIDAENLASGNLLEDAGFRKEAYFREDFLWQEKFRDSVHYGLLRSEFNALI